MDEKTMNKPTDCPRFEGCSANICPLVNGGGFIWYPDEEVCLLSEFSGLDWVKRQRRLKKKAVPDYYFTLTMLQQDFIIKKGICGLDPDKDTCTVEGDENKWLKSHPEKREMSEGDKQILRNRMLKIRQGLIPV